MVTNKQTNRARNSKLSNIQYLCISGLGAKQYITLKSWSTVSKLSMTFFILKFTYFHLWWQTDKQTNIYTIWSIGYQNKGHSASGKNEKFGVFSKMWEKLFCLEGYPYSSFKMRDILAISNIQQISWKFGCHLYGKKSTFNFQKWGYFGLKKIFHKFLETSFIIKHPWLNWGGRSLGKAGAHTTWMHTDFFDHHKRLLRAGYRHSVKD